MCGASRRSLRFEDFSSRTIDFQSDPAGSHLWSKAGGDSYSQSGERIAADEDGNVYLAGVLCASCVVFDGNPICSNMIDDDIFVAKFNPAGEYQWGKAFGGAGNDYIEGLAVDAAGNIYLTGAFTDTIDFGGGMLGPIPTEPSEFAVTDVYVAKLSTKGDHLFSASYGTTYIDYGGGIGIDPSGDALVAGFYTRSISFGGEEILKDVGTNPGAVFLTRLPVK